MAEPQSSGTPSMVISVRAVTLTVAILCTALYMRRFVIKSFGIDDYLVMVALVFVNGFSALAYTITYYGLGRHTWDVPNVHLVTWLKIYYAALCSYLVVAFAVKVSLVTFIMRVFPQDYVRKGGLALIGFMTLFTISGELALAFQCKPIRAFWDKTITTATCFSTDTMFGITMYQGVVMFVCDVIIVGLPILPIWGLQMPVKRRLSVVFLFSFGILASAAALVRFSTLAYTKDSVDITYSASTSLIWMEIEFNIGLLAGSLSSVRQLFKIRSIFSSHERSTGPDSKLASGNYELRKKAPWKDRGIMKTSELHTRVDELVRPESQERIVPIYGQGDSVRTDVSGRY
ncbi:predicted protein [Aspergillus terreus NIH2624]|uniref:Rhodopsin domain-containing protein n=1 Tax=Aspergillus terreus (strain NIH 2624 / FGSC A1156) TaxID=341663 RepID=Q0C7P3_ASPTN|nr:uncharacterized protein ATEG_10291 [Aspergillus terreus NIH2624]EAU29288.1 predicted protein [Aspergillus terreus NIH2624]